MSKIYTLKKLQLLPISLHEAWDFFSDPANLVNITPANMGFNIISKNHGKKMYAGQIIEYTVNPVLGIPLYWLTEITHVELLKYFIDEQRYGPYSFWHHQHHFKQAENGVEITDIVHYKVPFWFLGELANTLFVRDQLNRIFDYRYQKSGRDIWENYNITATRILPHIAAVHIVRRTSHIVHSTSYIPHNNRYPTALNFVNIYYFVLKN